MRWNMMTDIDWDKFDPGRVDPEILKTVKAAALVEANAPDYVAYLSGIWADAPGMIAALDMWGREESQHGAALAKWAALADPSFDFDTSLARFREIQGIDTEAASSIRGSRTNELIARCVVESGTSSLYAAIRDKTDEPVLKQLAARIAADEFAHYGMFLKQAGDEPVQPGLATRLRVAFGRLFEASDDELAGAYYCANYGPDSATRYDRSTFSNAYQKRVLGIYQRRHIDRLIAMISKAAGLDPGRALVRGLQGLAWRVLMWRKRQLVKLAY
ncbi:MAG: rubrerythrin family protein [Hyphomicrobiales bacterium]|nr:MAG: rubrerythrin family protein [Hyphomicrobiales bacterium]